MRKKLRCLLCLPLFLLLAGCPLPYGQVDYEIVYPSGYARGPDTWDELAPVEGTDWQLGCQRAEDWDKTRNWDLQVLDGEGKLLYTYPGLGRSVLRGEGTGDGAAWLCSELWHAPQLNGCTSGDLKNSHLLLVDMADGSVLFQKELGANELFLTAREDRCYFYYCGNEGGEQLFGLIKTPARNSCIYYRDRSNWEDAVLVYDFGYVEWMEEPDGRLSHAFGLHFYLEEDGITVTATARERPDLATQTWSEVEKASVTIPLTELDAV